MVNRKRSECPIQSTYVDVARHVCQEARIVLTSLRGGPPHVARGDLAHDLMELRKRLEREIEQNSPSVTVDNIAPDSDATDDQTKTAKQSNETSTDDIPHAQLECDATTHNEIFEENTTTATQTVDNPKESANCETNPDLQNPSNQRTPVPMKLPHLDGQKPLHPARYLNAYARPFLQVIMDPRASGPHTLVTLRAVYRLVDYNSFHFLGVTSEELTQSILACKFEQTDAGADEAVEMAIADVLRLLIQQDYDNLSLEQEQAASVATTMKPTSHPMSVFALMDAFNTVFVTRKTFVHSPALCHHFEDVLNSMVESVFSHHKFSSHHTDCARLVLQFLVNQLLHTPLVGGDGLDESTRETQMNHNDTRTSCLRLTRTAIRMGWTDHYGEQYPVINQISAANHEDENRTLLQIIQDDLCLSLLMTGQAIWAYHDHANNISPGFVSLEVLSEICATLSILWTTVSLRSQLVPQFETILTGFYTRALVLLRKRNQPTNSLSFNSNLIFDAEVEIILESLADLLCLHEQGRSIANGDGGSLQTMFASYDCHMRRSDVATGLVIELCRCCGGAVSEEGEANLSTMRSLSQTLENTSDNESMNSEVDSPLAVNGSSENIESLVRVEHPYRQVPAHLKELCAQAIMGGMKCLFREDSPSPETLVARSKRKKSILTRYSSSGMSLDEAAPALAGEATNGSHVLRDLKARKRLMRKAARVFNQHASRGIEFLVDSGLVEDPVTPDAVASFLRNGLVVGLDKKQIGAYLGESGKSPVAGKSPPSWERDWFHKDVLRIYCSLFRFEHQSLLDGLRMFLATFRLPGESQQIDRILQAFADSCGQVCDESPFGRLKLFSDDPKRASDAAYLLSFSIIMLNTDRHNKNIREDRKMSCEAFIKNNTDYGRDITERGREFPPEYLTSIYDSINDEEIRTEGEGADGAMTVERWKDVLRGSTIEVTEVDKPPSLRDAEDLTELVLEHVWKPIMSAIGALWGATLQRYNQLSDSPGNPNTTDSSQGGMLAVQGGRLGMDLSLEMLGGVRRLGRVDIFRKIFSWICEYTGLLDEYSGSCHERGLRIINSIESQSAVVVALKTCFEAGDDLNEDCWRQVWSILFELRDLKLIAAGNKGMTHSLLVESDVDFLRTAARIDWNMCLAKGDMNYTTRTANEQNKGRKVSSVLGAFGRALFGASDNGNTQREAPIEVAESCERSVHGKENLQMWNDTAASDDEGDAEEDISHDLHMVPGLHTIGDLFESRLIRENLAMSRQLEMPVTGLERVEETRRYQMSHRAQTRERFRYCLNLSAILSESRFMDETSFLVVMKSLICMISCSVKNNRADNVQTTGPSNREARSLSFDSTSTTSFPIALWNVPVSPASEAFGEVLLCELALKNKDRLKSVWSDVLQDHYLGKLTSILVNPVETRAGTKILPDPGLEKRVSGLLRLSIYALQRAELANDVIASWKYLLPINDEQHASSPLRFLDRQMAEGLWRIVSQIESISNLNDDGWEGVLSILCWCAKRATALQLVPPGLPSGLAEDDPALQCYRSLHLLLNTNEIEEKIPCALVSSLKCLVTAGDKRRYPQLSTACLDLLGVLHEKKLSQARTFKGVDSTLESNFWMTCWRKIIEGFTEAAELSTDTNIRQHALSVLTDLFLNTQGNLIPLEPLCTVLKETCIPLAARRILRLQVRDSTITTSEDLLTEFDLCIGLLFKPLRHHLNQISVSKEHISSIWKLVLQSLENFFMDDESNDNYEGDEEVIPSALKSSMATHIYEHLHNAVAFLMSADIIVKESAVPDDLTTLTWTSISKMGVNSDTLQEWKSRSSTSQNFGNGISSSA